MIKVKWRNDGSALASVGEDGCVKIWSKSGQPRSTLVQEQSPIYCVVWSPESDKILYCCGNNLHVKPIQAGNKAFSWKAHDGIVLEADWNPTNNLIVSCGEDCRYKVFDEFGRMIFQSKPYEYVTTAISWAPSGEYFAVGGYEMLRLCDKTGWTQSFDQTSTGSLMKIQWSQDGTVCAGAGGTGKVLFAQVVDKCVSYLNWDLRMADQNRIYVTDLTSESTDDLSQIPVLDFPDRIVNFSLQYDHLIVVTPSKCYIYKTDVTQHQHSVG